MQKNINNANCMLAFVFIANLIGAGFASGQELLVFFAVYGYKGMLGVLVAGALFTVCGGGIISLAQKQNWHNHQDLANMLLPNPFNKILDWLISAFLLALIGVMLSAAGALFQQELGVTPIYGIGILWIVLLLMLCGSDENFLNIQKFLIPPLLFVIIWVSLYGICNFNYTPHPTATTGNWLLSALCYASYNLLGGISTMIATAHLGGDKKGGIWGGLIITFLAALMVWALLVSSPQIASYPLPMVYLAYLGGNTLFFLYVVVLGIAILTTALTAAYSLSCRMYRLKTPRLFKNILILTMALPITIGDFPKIVSRTYGFFGLIGMVLLIILGVKLVFRHLKRQK